MNLLEIVSNITLGERRKDYGRPLLNHIRIAIIWSVYLEKLISPLDVAFMMDGLKYSREIETPKFDNVVDTAGYMNCVDDMIEHILEIRGVIGGTKDEGMKLLKNLTITEMFDILLTKGV